MGKTVTLRIQRGAPTANPPYQRFRAPETGTYKIALHDYEQAQWGYKPRAYTLGWSKTTNPEGAYPDTVYLPGMKPTDFHPLNWEWQYFWLGLMKRACWNLIPPGELLQRWKTITSDGRALTDKHTWNWAKSGEPKLYADYIQGLNLDSVYGPMQQKSLTMGGNLVKVIGSDGTNYVIETLNISAGKPPLLDDVWGKWWLVHWGTQSTIRKLSEGYLVTDWSWLNWQGVGYGVPFMLIGREGKNLIPKRQCRDIANGSEFTPYNP